MFLSAKADAVIDELKAHFTLKVVENPAKGPCCHLGATIGTYIHPDGSSSWCISADNNLKKAIPTVEAEWDESLYKKASSPLSHDDHREMDTTLLSDEDTSLFASYIGILQWAVELARIDLTQSVALMSRFRSFPREGHMEAVLRIFGYIKMHWHSWLVFDQQYRDWSAVDWVEGADWKEFYPGVCEALPPGAPEPLGGEGQLSVFVDATHETCLATQRSTTGIMMILNGGSIKWYSKRQNTVKSSTFGSEFVEMKIGVEMNDAIHYKRRMFGVPIGQLICLGIMHALFAALRTPSSC
jgi:hypothetical protein